MTFDNHNLELLKELRRKIPKEISQSKLNESSNPIETKNQKLHPVEIETNPEQLYRELMDISPDGNIPPHLLDRLKEIETNSVKPSSNIDPVKNVKYQDISNNESLKLYTEFKKFLLEDDID